MIRRPSLWAAASAFAIVATGQAVAQEAVVEDGSETKRLEQVTVTAVKREQSLNDVPVAVTAFTEDIRQELALDSLGDFARFTPSLSFSSGDDRVFVRGIGRQTNTNGSDPGIATYADGIYDSATSAVSKSDFFVERVEVLRGPQGTLYGRNSIGGAINVISKRPTDEFSAEARVGLGNYEMGEIEASISGPISKNVRGKLGASFRDQKEGYFENAAGGPSEGGVNETTYVEAQLELDPSENFSLWLKADYLDVSLRNRNHNLVTPYDVHPFPPGSLTPGAGFGYLMPGYTQAGSATSNPGVDDIRKFNTDTTSRANIDGNYGLSAIATWSLPTIDIKYSGGYRIFDYNAIRDDDHTDMLSYAYPLDPADMFAGELLTGGPNCAWIAQNIAPICGPAIVNPSRTFGYIEDREYWSHELTAQSTTDSKLWWIAGLYNYGENAHQESHFGNAAQVQLQAPLLAPPNPSGDYVTAISDLRTKSYAVFGQADYSVTDTVTLTGGLRYSKDEKEGTERIRVVGYIPTPGLTLGGSGSLLPALDLTSALISFADAEGTLGPASINPETGFGHRSLAHDWSAVTGVAGIQWQPTSDSNYFFRYSRGYKSGGFNAGGISQYPLTDKELLDSFELGAKKSFGDSLQLNATYYYYKYDGLQVPLDAVENGIKVTRFFNLEDSRAQGIELEAMWTPIENLRVMANYAYNDSEVRDGCCFIDVVDPLALQPGANPASAPDPDGNIAQNLKGQQLPRTVPHQVGVNISYDIALGGLGDLTLSGNYSWQEATYHGIFNRTYTETPAFDQVDLVAVWRSPTDRYRVVGYVKNVFDEEGYEGASGALMGFPAGDVAQTYYLTPPRLLGLQLQVSF